MEITYVNNFRNLRREDEREKKLSGSIKRRKWKHSKYWAKRLKRASQTLIYKWSIFLKKYKEKIKSDIFLIKDENICPLLSSFVFVLYLLSIN